MIFHATSEFWADANRRPAVVDSGDEADGNSFIAISGPCGIRVG